MSNWFLMKPEDLQWIELLLPTLAKQIKERMVKTGDVVP